MIFVTTLAPSCPADERALRATVLSPPTPKIMPPVLCMGWYFFGRGPAKYVLRPPLVRERDTHSQRETGEGSQRESLRVVSELESGRGGGGGGGETGRVGGG